MTTEEYERKRQDGIRKLMTLSPEEMEAVRSYVSQHPIELLQILGVRNTITQMRIKKLNPDSIRTFDGSRDGLIENAVEHNLDGLLNAWSLSRPLCLIYPLLCLTAIHSRIGDLKVLTIGPRTESELLTLIAVGFKPEHIYGLDLMSYNGMVDVGDMHDMPYKDDEFDIVIAGWVIAYSQNRKQAAREILRVLKPNGFVAIGCEHKAQTDGTEEEFFKKQGLSQRLDKATDYTTWSEQGILDLFDGIEKKVVFVSDESDRPDLGGAAIGVMVIFQTL
jgi:SAM-dependent methyltransferase